jgi:Flp pilus assembly protein TadG
MERIRVARASTFGLAKRSTDRLRRVRGRTGVLSMELVFTLPILGLFLLGMFEFTVLFFSRGELVEASRVAARKGTLPGVTAQDVEDEVRKVLNPRLHDSLQVDSILGEKSGDVVAVAVSVDMSAAAPDLLWPIGYSLQGRQLLSETRMIRE